MTVGNILAVQSYGYIKNKSDLSSGALGSWGRILYAALLVGAGVIKKEGLIAVFPQGKGAAPARNLGVMLGDALASRQEMKDIPVFAQPRGWGTVEDVLNTYKMVRERGYSWAHISFVSDPVHIKRVELIWQYTKPLGWTASFYGSPFHQMMWQERWLREPAARLHCWWKLGREKR